MIRIGTNQLANTSIADISERQAAMAELQQHISSGRRVNKPSDDPIASAQAEQIRSDIASIDVEHRMASFALTRLQQAESATGSGVEVFQGARDLLLAANNDTNGPFERRMYAQQLRGLRAELLDVANRTDGLGFFIFGGAGSQQPPFEEVAGQVVYTADPGEQVTGRQGQYTTSFDGRSLFFSLTGPTGANESVFDMFDRVIALLEDDTVTSPDLHNGVQAGIDSLDDAMNHFSATRARIGEQLAGAERALQSMADSKLHSVSRLSDLTDTDLAEAISELSSLQTEMDAALRTYVQISGLSLFDYIR